MDYEPICPQCGASEAIYQGALGNSVWYRCRDCGWAYRVVTDGDLPALLREQAQ